MGKIKELDIEMAESAELVAQMTKMLLRYKSKGFQISCMLCACVCFVKHILEDETLAEEDFLEKRRGILKFLAGFSGKIFQTNWKGNKNE